jgi:dephospho-CoA kinase
MLRVGLTGGLGSGKSTAAHLFSALGVHVIQADEIGRELMQPGQVVFHELVEHFGAKIVSPDGTLDRRQLADLAFRHGRLHELNEIVHPPVIAQQESRMAAFFREDERAIVMVESALIFEASGEASATAGSEATGRGTVPGWRQRFDRIVLVTASDEQKIARYVSRSPHPPAAGSSEERSLVEAARVRLATQIPNKEKIPFADYIIDNSGPRSAMESAVNDIYQKLKAEAAANRAEAVVLARRVEQ